MGIKLAMFLGLGACVGSAAGQESLNGRIRIEVLTHEGIPVRNFKVHLLERFTRKDFADHFSGGAARAVPYGEYFLRVTSRGCEDHEQVLGVNEPFLNFRVFLRLGDYIPTRPATVKGRVVLPKENKNRHWVRLIPLLGRDTLAETEIIAVDGSFEISGVREGRYVLVVMEYLNVVLMREIAIYGETTLKEPLVPGPRAP